MLAPDSIGGMEQSPRADWELVERVVDTIPV
jgi:hypothetical protein